MKLILVAGATSIITQVVIQDSSSTVGAGKTGLLFNTASLACYYHRDTDTTATAMSLVTMTSGTHTTNGFIEIDSANMPGAYQLGLPNAAIAAGAKSVLVMLKGATNMAPCPFEIQLTAFDLNIATQKVDVDTIKTNPVVNGGTVTFTTNSTVASTTNITSATGIDVTKWNGTNVSAPATAGIPEVNVKNINNVSTTAVTSVLAVQGTSQLVNSTGTGTSALVKADVIDWASSAVASAASGIPKVDVDTIKTNPVVNGGTVTFTTNSTVASTTNITAGTITTVSGNVSGNVVGSVLGNVAGSVLGNVVGNVNGNVNGSVASVTAGVTVAVGGLAATGFAANAIDASALATSAANEIADAVKARQLTESYAADTVAPTLEQALFSIQQNLTQFSIAGTLITVQKIDKTTTAQTYDIDSATTPTLRKRTT